MSIEVDESSKLSKALRLHPDVLDYIVSLNPHDFKRLYNPLMRRMMPPRISLARVAEMTGTPYYGNADAHPRNCREPVDSHGEKGAGY